MSYLVDTNVLLRSVQKTHPMHDAAIRAVKTLLAQGEELSITPQNLIEFWAVATRPVASNGLELTPNEAAQEIAHLKSIFMLLPDTAAIFSEWEKLVRQYGVAGKQTHDARIVAVMNAYGVKNLLTFNTEDFIRYHGITVVRPQDLEAKQK